jgi:hypothetical protein
VVDVDAAKIIRRSTRHRMDASEEGWHCIVALQKMEWWVGVWRSLNSIR